MNIFRILAKRPLTVGLTGLGITLANHSGLLDLTFAVHAQSPNGGPQAPQPGQIFVGMTMGGDVACNAGKAIGFIGAASIRYYTVTGDSAKLADSVTLMPMGLGTVTDGQQLRLPTSGDPLTADSDIVQKLAKAVEGFAQLSSKSTIQENFLAGKALKILKCDH